jgi:oxygen-independent coproporphyrinogen-3 oxidase
MSNPRVQADPATTPTGAWKTEVGSVFVSNYPPYSFWSGENLSAVKEVLDSPPGPSPAGLGLYLHIPFCRRRCKFCYFRVYVDKNSAEIRTYLEALAREVEIYGNMPRVSGRTLGFVYFGGGTPSYISSGDLRTLARRLQASLSWDGAEEVTFECEPGTLTRTKLEAIKDIGVTRLSLGVENFNDEILRENGRAHLSREVFAVVPWIKALDFDQVNVDLIAGMVGETWSSWKDTVRKAVDMDADSVTVYQMELPYNTLYSKAALRGNGQGPGVADWETKREWHHYAFERLAAAGYEVSSAYTMVKKARTRAFVYRDSLWRSSDLIGAGVASFSHMGGLHFQNAAAWGDYIAALEGGQLPLDRAFATTAEERLTREMILQLKLGKISRGYFREKFGVDILAAFSQAYEDLKTEGMLAWDSEAVELTRKGLLRVDQLLPQFYHPKYRNARYT